MNAMVGLRRRPSSLCFRQRSLPSTNQSFIRGKHPEMTRYEGYDEVNDQTTSKATDDNLTDSTIKTANRTFDIIYIMRTYKHVDIGSVPWETPAASELDATS
jgi:hypothetical protein